jgi:DNA-binding protein H-NS
MALPGFKNMDVDGLLSLRDDIDRQLGRKRRELQQQLARLGIATGGGGPRRTGVRTSSLRGRKVAPKYRGPAGETWAGRGQRPRWLVALIKQGRKISEFAIAKSGGGRKKRSVAKKSRKKRR